MKPKKLTQVTVWSPHGEVIGTALGPMTMLGWCRREVERLETAGRHAKVEQDKIGRVAVFASLLDTHRAGGRCPYGCRPESAT